MCLPVLGRNRSGGIEVEQDMLNGSIPAKTLARRQSQVLFCPYVTLLGWPVRLLYYFDGKVRLTGQNCVEASLQYCPHGRKSQKGDDKG